MTTEDLAGQYAALAATPMHRPPEPGRIVFDGDSVSVALPDGRYQHTIILADGRRGVGEHEDANTAATLAREALERP